MLISCNVESFEKSVSCGLLQILMVLYIYGVQYSCGTAFDEKPWPVWARVAKNANHLLYIVTIMRECLKHQNLFFSLEKVATAFHHRPFHDCLLQWYHMNYVCSYPMHFI